MKFVWTDGADPAFSDLCRVLDAELIELNGADVQEGFAPFNTLEDIHDVLLVLDGECVAAGAGFKRFDSRTVELKRVFVRPPYRRQGLAGKVIGALEQRAREQGYIQMLVETGTAMEGAQRLYASLGYTPCPKFPPYVGNPHSACFCKELTKENCHV